MRWGEGEGDGLGDRTDSYPLLQVKQLVGSRCSTEVQKGALQSWDVGVGRRFKKEGIYEYILLILCVVQQKLTVW